MIKVISFDLDDTLWEVKAVLIGAEKRSSAFLMKHCPILFDRFTFAEMNDRRLALWKTRTDLHHQISALRIESVKALILECGIDEQEASRLANAAFEEFIEARHDVCLYDGVADCLETLHTDYTLVALTNGNADITRLDIGQFFDHGIKAEDINSSKPAAPHFELTLQRYAIEPEQMLHVGDNAEHDVVGAHQMGIASVWVNNTGKKWPEELAPVEPDFVVASVTELPALIASRDNQGITR